VRLQTHAVEGTFFTAELFGETMRRAESMISPACNLRVRARETFSQA